METVIHERTYRWDAPLNIDSTVDVDGTPWRVTALGALSNGRLPVQLFDAEVAARTADPDVIEE